MPKSFSKKQVFTSAVGRRREASCRVRLHKGEGQHMVNDKPIGEYFPGQVAKTAWMRPFELTSTLGKYYITAKVSGGGVRGQLVSVVHGTARAFAALNPDKYRFVLKSAGLLTRDARTRERRKVGTGGKSRRAKQSPKR